MTRTHVAHPIGGAGARVVRAPAAGQPARNLARPHLLGGGIDPTRVPPTDALVRSTLLGFQETHGNAFVQRQMLQRDVDDEYDLTNDEVIEYALVRGESDKEPFYKLSEDAAKGNLGPMIGRINGDARTVAQWFNSSRITHDNWLTSLVFVKTHSDQGAAANTKVEAAQAAIGGAAKDKAGQYSRERVEEYIAAIQQADQKVRAIGGLREGLDIAVSEMHTATLEQKQLNKQRDVNKKQEEVNAEQKRIDDQKAMIAKFTGFAVSLVKPETWVSMAVAATVCVGETILEANVPKGSIEQLQKQLQEAKTELRQIEDEAQLSRINTAAQKVNAASHRLADAKKDFLDLYETIQLKETTIVETLGKSKKTAGAASAIAERGAVANAAMETENHILAYKELAPVLLGKIDKLNTDYSVVLSAIKAATNRSAAYVEHYTSVPTHNRQVLAELSRLINALLQQTDQHLAYLAKGEYLSGYDRIPQTLQAALKNRNKTK